MLGYTMGPGTREPGFCPSCAKEQGGLEHRLSARTPGVQPNCGRGKESGGLEQWGPVLLMFFFSSRRRKRFITKVSCTEHPLPWVTPVA